MNPFKNSRSGRHRDRFRKANRNGDLGDMFGSNAPGIEVKDIHTDVTEVIPASPGLNPHVRRRSSAVHPGQRLVPMPNVVMVSPRALPTGPLRTSTPAPYYNAPNVNAARGNFDADAGVLQYAPPPPLNAVLGTSNALTWTGRTAFAYQVPDTMLPGVQRLKTSGGYGFGDLGLFTVRPPPIIVSPPPPPRPAPLPTPIPAPVPTFTNPPPLPVMPPPVVRPGVVPLPVTVAPGAGSGGLVQLQPPPTPQPIPEAMPPPPGVVPVPGATVPPAGSAPTATGTPGGSACGVSVYCDGAGNVITDANGIPIAVPQTGSGGADASSGDSGGGAPAPAPAASTGADTTGGAVTAAPPAGFQMPTWGWVAIGLGALLVLRR